MNIRLNQSLGNKRPQKLNDCADETLLWIEFYPEKGIRPYFGSGINGLCYNTRRKMSEFDGMKPGETRYYKIEIPKLVWVSITEFQKKEK